jgi:hypothetical protein
LMIELWQTIMGRGVQETTGNNPYWQKNSLNGNRKAWNISWNISTVTGLSDPKYLTDPTRLISTRTKVSDGYVKQWYNANSKGCGGLWNWFEVSRTAGKNLHWKIQRYNIRTRDRKYFLLEIPGFA